MGLVITSLVSVPQFGAVCPVSGSPVTLSTWLRCKHRRQAVEPLIM